MALSVGSRIGPYEVETLLGSGGMGEVYRARDTNLGREVAIKVLPEAFAQDAERLARFEREAKTLASLNHPNIAAVHGFEKSENVRALVMELVEGPTLADEIERRTGPFAFAEATADKSGPAGLPLDEALPIARQIAEALEAAHEQGIVHRDLKPANIKVRDDGTVKVLDFGLAKLIGDGPADAGQYADRTTSPTITTPAMTQLGMILGTAAYMAPEQARGKPVDKRSDIWAFGCVLFEMLAGKRAFDGEDVTDTIAAVVRAEPTWEALPADVPASIRLLLRRCLEKDRRKRIGDISTALFIMKEQSALPGPSPAPEIVAPPAKWGQIARYALAATLTAAITAGVVWMLTRPDPPRVSRLELTTSGASALAVTVNAPHLAVTRDGSSVIYVGGSPGLDPSLFVERSISSNQRS
jgi:serine/threonine protein kinase